MTNEEMIRKTAAINYEIIIAHGMADGGVGFEWQGIFIHDPFVDPQYGAFPVDPIQQYGADYLESIFVQDPGSALQMARREMRGKANEDLIRHCSDSGLDANEILAVVRAACGVRVLPSANPLEALADEEVARVWAHIDCTANGSPIQREQVSP